MAARSETSAETLSSRDKESLANKYEILEEVGRGAMGAIYRGRHRKLDRQVALKVCLPGSSVDRFEREASLLAQLRSPHVVEVHDFEMLDAQRALMVMDWIEGSDLAELIRTAHGPLREARVLPWMRQVCAGMQAAAVEGIVHRDLKPSNILIDNHDCSYVADFGLARSPTVNHLSMSGLLLGTPYYMAPEQAEDPRRVDTRADIYSFGATFYHALTGQPPFEADSLISVLFMHKAEPLVSPKSINALLDDRVSECLERCMAKAPYDRFTTFDDVRASLCVDESGPSPWTASDEPEITPYVRRYQSRRSLYLQGDPTALAEPDRYKLSGEKAITIGFGDITTQDVDAIVSSDDGCFAMAGGTSAAILSAGGVQIAEQARCFAPVRPGRALLTSAGNLPCRFVFHGVSLGGWKEKWIRPSRDIILEVMESCFYHADSLGLQTIAFPLIGTGAGGFPRDVCLDAMFRFLARKLLRGLTSIGEARIVLYPGQYQ